MTCCNKHIRRSAEAALIKPSPNALCKMLRVISSMAIIASSCAFSGIAPMGRTALRSFARGSLRGGASSFATQTKMHLKEGDAVPNVIFKARVRDEKIGGPNPFTWKDVSSADLFKGKRAVVFSLPGAFTPTCSSTHLPGYEKAYEEIKSHGVDEIYCLSVNDAFVMRQWGLHQGLPEEKTSTANPLNPGNFQKVKLLPDGAALFTRGMGMSCTWDSERGFGERSWRYSAVINDMKIEKLFIEVRPLMRKRCTFYFFMTHCYCRLERLSRTLDLTLSRCRMLPLCSTTSRARSKLHASFFAESCKVLQGFPRFLRRLAAVEVARNNEDALDISFLYTITANHSEGAARNCVPAL